MTCAPSEDSDQPESDQSLRYPLEEALGPCLPIKCTGKTVQTGQMPRLICVLAGHTGHIVGFVSWQLKYRNICKKRKNNRNNKIKIT